jgi:hypothetical protein
MNPLVEHFGPADTLGGQGGQVPLLGRAQHGARRDGGRETCDDQDVPLIVPVNPGSPVPTPAAPTTGRFGDTAPSPPTSPPVPQATAGAAHRAGWSLGLGLGARGGMLLVPSRQACAHRGHPGSCRFCRGWCPFLRISIVAVPRLNRLV